MEQNFPCEGILKLHKSGTSDVPVGTAGLSSTTANYINQLLLSTIKFNGSIFLLLVKF